MEIRDIEIFLALAEELHFGRTADRLRVTPARVSQAVKKQERLIGGELFDRDSRNVRLTPLGEQLRADLQPVYEGLHEGLARAKRRAKGKSRTLRVGMINSNGYELRDYFEAYRDAFPDVEVEVRHHPYVEWAERLRAKEVDIVVAWLPVEEPDLTTGPVIFTEPRLLVLAAGHRLAAREVVPLEVLEDHMVTRGAGNLPESWEDAFVPLVTPNGRPITRHEKHTTDIQDLLARVSSGEVVHLLGAHSARYHARPDLVYRSLEENVRLHWALIWHNESPEIRDFARVVKELGPLHLD